MKPTTAVIFAAGTGSRMLPLTAAVQKELLPIGNRPVVDYIVSDLVAAGVTRIIFVIRPGQTGLKDYYLGNPELEGRLKLLDKTDAIAQLETIHDQAKFDFVEHPLSAGYGTAVPLQLALPLLTTDEPAIVCSGDDFIWRPDGTSEMADFIQTYQAGRGAGALMAREVGAHEVSAFGLLQTHEDNGREYLTDLIEKPSDHDAPSNLVNISKYILDGTLREYVRSVKPDPKSGELFITDAVGAAAKDQKIAVHRIKGQYLDTGNLESWLHANQVVTAGSQKTAH